MPRCSILWRKAVRAAGENPVLIDTYLQDAIEVDVDALGDSEGSVYIAGVMEHIEEAGVHSGDSACSLPPRSLDRETIRQIEEQTVLLARELRVRGLMNVQFAVKGREIFVLEVNPRASRTVPFVAKATGGGGGEDRFEGDGGVHTCRLRAGGTRRRDALRGG